jgi:hypothetical protein
MADIAPLTQTIRSERLDQGPYVTVVNRTTRGLTVKVDGRTWILKPGINANIPHVVATYAIKQHPRLGTFDKTMGRGQSLVGVLGHSDPRDLAPIKPGEEHLGNEYINRDENPLPKNTEFEALPERRRVEERDPLAGETVHIDLISER